VNAQSADSDVEYRRALMAAADRGDAGELKQALQHLQAAAEAGHRGAQAELAALVGNWNLVRRLRDGAAQPADLWARLGAAVDVRGWLAVPAGKALAERPRIATVKKFLSPQVCDWLITLAGGHLEDATIYDTATGDTKVDFKRNNRSAHMTAERSDALLLFVRARIAALAELPVFALETTQVLHYEIGQRFAAHYDFLDAKFEGYAREIAANGQRALTVLVSLNDDYEGGATAFPEINLEHKGRKGDALIFWNLTEDGAPDFLTKHVGTPPTRGVKWLLSQWIRVKA
jgi:hypothetical protein